ncbi:leukocyte cysteine proteinase inhibitor 1-like [Saccostrea echinata]|uniref:leukocyte cysteine proteinase inhibitor 1-like n=1 Tax=Saccostrea echinata TaxID=191078 RepID=UPI002A8053AD|nr:leukocyte cysteine proteinase inhibitor 1-like [Saccostrea echinata]
MASRVLFGSIQVVEVWGLGEQQFATPGVQALVQANRNAIIRKLPPDILEPIGRMKALVFREQLVAGTNYFIKVKIGGGHRPQFIHVRIYADLNNRSRVDGVKFANQYDPILFF